MRMVYCEKCAEAWPTYSETNEGIECLGGGVVRDATAEEVEAFERDYARMADWKEDY